MFQINTRHERLIKEVDRACDCKDPETAEALRKFCAVLICGFVERSVEVIISERLKPRAQTQVLNFIKSHFKRGINFNCGAITDLLGRFDAQWRERFEQKIKENDKHREGLDSLYSVRNSLAHGGNSGISQAILRERLETSKIIVDLLLESTA